MIRFYLLPALALLFVSVSCNSDGKASGSNDNATSRQELVADSDSVVMDDTVNKISGKAVASPGAIKPVEVSKATINPETSTDRLVKQYGETLVTLIEASKAGKQEEATTKKLEDLKKQLEELDKSGKLNTNQKELFKVTSEAYKKLNK